MRYQKIVLDEIEVEGGKLWIVYDRRYKCVDVVYVDRWDEQLKRPPVYNVTLGLTYDWYTVYRLKKMGGERS